MDKVSWNKKYEQMLHDPSMSKEDIADYLWGNGYTPRYLYKYFSFDKEYWHKNMIQGEIFLNKADALNDPLDCLYQINVEKYLELTILDFNNSGIDINLDPKNYCRMKELSYTRLNKWATQLQSKTRVTCFTEKFNSLLMWGHYTYKHQGFCIKYDLKKIKPKVRNLILPVIYCNQPYDMSKLICRPQESNAHLYVTPFMYKYNIWAYEKEWRIVLHEEEWEKICGDLNAKGAIDTVYFGYKAPEVTYFSIAKKECKKNSIKAKRIVPVDNSYELSFENL